MIIKWIRKRKLILQLRYNFTITTEFNVMHNWRFANMNIIENFKTILIQWLGERFPQLLSTFHEQFPDKSSLKIVSRHFHPWFNALVKIRQKGKVEWVSRGLVNVLNSICTISKHRETFRSCFVVLMNVARCFSFSRLWIFSHFHAFMAHKRGKKYEIQLYVLTIDIAERSKRFCIISLRENSCQNFGFTKGFEFFKSGQSPRISAFHVLDTIWIECIYFLFTGISIYINAKIFNVLFRLRCHELQPCIY